jgi:hypothetical protein
MRVLFIAAIIAASIAGRASAAMLQETAPEATPAPSASAPERTADFGVMAPISDPDEPVAAPQPRRRRAAPPKAAADESSAPSSVLAQAPPPPPIEAPTLAYQLGIIRAEQAHLDVLDGRSGPFKQAIAAWRVKDWYHFTFAMTTLLIWVVVLGIVAAVTRSFIRRRRENV